jgi:hypothetical protein
MSSTSPPTVAWILQRRELIRFAWRRVLISPTPEMRARWAECARRLQSEVDAQVGKAQVAVPAERDPSTTGQLHSMRA